MNNTSILDECIELLKANKNLILTGAPGTGKTYLAREIASKLTGSNMKQSILNDTFETLIHKYIKPGIPIKSSKNRATYNVDKIEKHKVFLSGEHNQPYGVPFQLIANAYQNRLWEGGQKNGLDPYTAALAKHIYESEQNSSTLEKANNLPSEIENIGFVQFHPSYDYTDFVEGLRPTSLDSGNIGFERKDGVFKKFCSKAISSGIIDTVDNFEECWFQLISKLNEQDYLDIPMLSGKLFRLELNVNGDGLANRTYENDTYEKNAWIQGKLKFFNKEQLYNVYKGFPGTPSGGFDNYRKAIIQYMKTNLGLNDYFKGIQNNTQQQSFVFIIDEINRGELSKIFGELFFSIDPGYRGEKRRVKTQYQNLITDTDDPFYDGFYVPENVYIIGTMNDIDRSIESMDFAMRRRFAWKEIKAEDNTQMLDSLGSLKQRTLNTMTRLNNAIWDENDQSGIQGLSAAYHIGGAYFKKLELYLNENHSNIEEAFQKLWDNHLQGVLFEYLRGSASAVSDLNRLKTIYFQAE